ncbi:MAG: OmpA family protein [Flavobacteriaceae bacterium]
MKPITKGILVAVVYLISAPIFAQDEDNPWVVSFGINAFDAYPTNSKESRLGTSGKWFEDFYKFDQWNTVPSFSTIGVSRNINESFSITGRFNINQITKQGPTEIQQQSFTALDIVLRNSLAKKGAMIDPFTEVGSSYSWISGEGAFGFNLGAGVAFWKNDNIGFSYQVNFRKSFEASGINYFQHLFGANIKFGGVDTDGDGVYDKNDACPEIAGLEEFSGCPDSDGDGITDKEDACPNRAGSLEMNGCPDSDGDGLSDLDDACPNRAGSPEMGGCPDTDGDGINDKDDACPDEAGVAENNGCPWADSDGDGVADKDDACPQLAGIPENNGCPALPEDVVDALNSEGSMIRFKAESAKIIGEKSTVLIQNIKNILESYPTITFIVEGHASSDGSQAYNQNLSEARAAAVEAALIAAGADASRIKTAAFGEDRPIGDNATARGRKINRRVQFTVGKN